MIDERGEREDDIDRGDGDGGPTDAENSASGASPAEVDYLWVMRTTFVVTILAGAPVVALLSVAVDLPTWNDRVAFAVRVGAVVWLVVALGVYWHARRRAPSTRV